MWQVLVVWFWSLSPGLLRTFACTKDFVPVSIKLTRAQCWVHVHSLNMKCWQPKAIFLNWMRDQNSYGFRWLHYQKIKGFFCSGSCGCWSSLYFASIAFGGASWFCFHNIYWIWKPSSFLFILQIDRSLAFFLQA